MVYYILYIVNIGTLIGFSAYKVIKNEREDILIFALVFATILLYNARGSVADISDVYGIVEYHNWVIILVLLLQIALIIVTIIAFWTFYLLRKIEKLEC